MQPSIGMDDVCPISMARVRSRVMVKKRTGDPDLGRRLRQKREFLGLSQEALATRVGIEQPSLSAFESGLSKPELPTMRRLGAALGESVDWLMNGPRSDVAGELKDFTEAVLGALSRRSWKAAARLSDQQRLQAAEEIAALLEAKGRTPQAPVKKTKKSR
jgi:transcriptional regulator with XRE-family HTH domain